MTDARDPLAEAMGEWLMNNDMEPDFRAILARHGLAVVPVEPTHGMVWAAPGRANQATEESMYHGIWRAMLAAAQEDQR